jgi:hypothetical protein
MCKKYNEYADLVRSHSLPDDFDQWRVANEDGWTIAHEAAMRGCIPADFNQWELANEDGRTVAHTAAFCGRLTLNFNQWELADDDGLTVAHELAESGYLPDDFDQWGMVTKSGWSVLSYFITFSQHTECYEHFQIKWAKQKPSCRTQEDWDIFREKLPEVYAKYTIVEFMSEVDVAEQSQMV